MKKRGKISEIWRDGKKRCSMCRKYKEYSEFGKQSSLKNNLRSGCRACYAKKDKEYQKKHAYSYRAMIKKLYGISIKEYRIMLEHQNNQCAICGTIQKDRRLSVDHCHQTGVVRGLLCNSCNHMLGNAKDDPSVLSAAIEYLRTQP